MSVFVIVDAQIEKGFEQFQHSMNLEDTMWSRHSFYITSIAILHDAPFEDSLMQHLFMTRLEHFRTLMLATIVYNLFFLKK